MVLVHVAAGAAAGTAVRSRLAAIPLGLALHAAADVVPHDDVASHRFEAASGIAALALLAARRGTLSPVTLTAAVSAAPDLEHPLPLPRPGGRKLFPTHRWPLRERSRRVPVAAQLVAALAVLAVVLVRPRAR